MLLRLMPWKTVTRFRTFRTRKGPKGMKIYLILMVWHLMLVDQVLVMLHHEMNGILWILIEYHLATMFSDCVRNLFSTNLFGTFSMSVCYQLACTWYFVLKNLRLCCCEPWARDYFYDVWIWTMYEAKLMLLLSVTWCFELTCHFIYIYVWH